MKKQSQIEKLNEELATKVNLWRYKVDDFKDNPHVQSMMKLMIDDFEKLYLSFPPFKRKQKKIK